MPSFRPSLVLPAALASAVALSGWAGCQQKLMPTPVMFQGAGIDPFRGETPGRRTPDFSVYIATDREPSGKTKNAASFYSNKRGLEVRLASATVDIGRGMSWQDLCEESLRKDRSDNPTESLAGLEEIGTLWTTLPPDPTHSFEPPADAAARAPADRFAAEVNARLAESRLKDIFIFVHGFNTAFADNLMLAAELHHYLGREGVFISYAWPSQDSVFGYTKDKANARYSTRPFRLFLSFLSEKTGARRINIIAHSAGAPIVVDAIWQLRLMHYGEDQAAVNARYRIGQVLLAAPDMDLDHYIAAALDGWAQVPDKVTIYMSTKDFALDLSSWIYGFARLGEPLKALTADNLRALKASTYLNVVDVSGAEKKHGSWLGHSYFHTDPWVSSDVILTLRFAVPPAERGLVRGGRDDAFWIYPKDYPERARQSARALYERIGEMQGQ